MSASMPQPWPTVSAVQATVTSRGAVRCGGVVNDAGDRLAPDAQVLQALKTRAIEDALARTQAGEIDARREVGRLERRGSDDARRVRERLSRRVFDDEARRPIGAAPDDGAIAVNVAGRDAKRGGGARRFRGHDRGRLAERGPRARAKQAGAGQLAERRGGSCCRP